MRITNKIMQRNNLANINTNKVYQDRLSTQMSTEKKVSRPSDDPVVAIRALRLRSNVTEITQYYSRNIPDAESWLSVTEGALKNLTGVITDMIKQCTKGSNGDLKIEDRQIILEQLKCLGEEVYSTGDADYAGRYVFTGYRTDTSLSFQEAAQKKYTITEQLHIDDADTTQKINSDKLLDWNTSNYKNAPIKDINEQSVSEKEIHRIRLAYDNCVNSNSIKVELPNPGGLPIEWSTAGSSARQIDVVSLYNQPDPYTLAGEVGDTASANSDKVIFVPETGELLLGEKAYAELAALKDIASTTQADESEIRITYEKKDWEKGNLRPEHYFACEADGIKYNEIYLDGNREKQAIEYDVGFNQTVRINSTADECFQHGIGRDVDDLVASMQEVLDLEAVKANIESCMEDSSLSSADKETLKNQLEAAEAALTFAKNKCQRMFEGGITKFQGYLDDANLSITACGTRSKKLELIETRIQEQKTTFETLKSENEDIDITEIVIQLTSAELTYEAALMATGKVSQTTLLNYI